MGQALTCGPGSSADWPTCAKGIILCNLSGKSWKTHVRSSRASQLVRYSGLVFAAEESVSGNIVLPHCLH